MRTAPYSPAWSTRSISSYKRRRAAAVGDSERCGAVEERCGVEGAELREETRWPEAATMPAEKQGTWCETPDAPAHASAASVCTARRCARAARSMRFRVCVWGSWRLYGRGAEDADLVVDEGVEDERQRNSEGSASNRLC
jgi:hypothetical protein